MVALLIATLHNVTGSYVRKIIGNDGRAILILTLLWMMGIAVVGVSGDFPLNDDWAYARGVASVLNHNALELDTWPAMTLITQVGIGIVYGKIFGFSFEVLRWSTLVNALLGVLIYYSICRRFAGTVPALFTAALLLYNPLFFSLAFTFMTEVHFLLFVFACLYSFFRYSEENRPIHLIAAAILGTLATLLRQPGILVPFSCGLILALSAPTGLRRLAVLLPVLVAFAALKGYDGWVESYHPHLFRVGGVDNMLHSLRTYSLGKLVKPLYNVYLYCGLFLAPLLILLLPTVRRSRSLPKVAAMIIGAVTAIYLTLRPAQFPLGNVFYNLGLGPRTLKGYYSNTVGNPGVPWWDVLDYLAVAGAVIAAILLISNVPPIILQGRRPFAKLSPRHLQWSMLAVFCTGYLVILMLIPVSFDRHTLPFIALVSPLVLSSRVPAKRLWVPATVALCILGGFSIAATHDYLSWNRSRMGAYHDLTVVRQIPPELLDAGFELNAWAKAGPERLGGTPPHQMWFVTEDEYAIAFEQLSGYSIIRSYPVYNLLPIGTDRLYTLKKDTDSAD